MLVQIAKYLFWLIVLTGFYRFKFTKIVTKEHFKTINFVLISHFMHFI